MDDLLPFFEAEHFGSSKENISGNPLQIGQKIYTAIAGIQDFEDAEIIIIGCGERRGSEQNKTYSTGLDKIRKELYKMYHWHKDIKILDAGNIMEGASVGDTKAVLRIVLEEIHQAGKIAIVLGGSQDLTLQQYEVFKNAQKTIHAAVIDGKIDLEERENISDEGFLMDMLTSEPNFVRHFSLLGFESYYTNPKMLETLDKLRFDCFRLGNVREQIEEMEPVLRDCDLVSIDLNVLRYSEAPFLTDASPNGLFSDELCLLTRYAGMSTKLSSLGIYGYEAENDFHNQGAKVIAQMLWYFIDGHFIRKNESSLSNDQNFIEFNLEISGYPVKFLKSKKSNRWWMQLVDKTFVSCSYKDYLLAANEGIPDRWLRAQERVV